MEISVRVLIFVFLLGAMMLNSCHPIRPNPENKQNISKKIDSLQLRTLGPNCWNGALIKAGIVHAVRFVPKGEYWFWMNSPYCRKLGKLEKPQKGDLGSLFWPTKGHYHSFVYLDSHWVFSKNSPDPKYKYQVQAFEEMFYPSYQKKAKKCWNSIHANLKNDCEFELQYHRCRSLETTFNKSDKKLVEWDRKVTPLEEAVYLWTTGESKVRPSDFEGTILDLFKIFEEVHVELKAESDKQRKFKLQAMEYRLIGLMLSDLNIASTSKKLFPIISQIYKLQSTKAPQVVTLN